MTDSNGHTSSQLDLYVDGLLSESERCEFEARLAADDGLRAEHELQASIDDSLRSLFSPPAVPRLPSPQRLVPGRGRFLRSGWLAVAAMVVIVLGIWGIWDQLRVRPLGPDQYQVPAWQSMEMAYLQKVNTGFKPAWVCENDQQFATAFWDVLGQAMQLKGLPAEVQIAGLSYANVHSRRTMLVLVRDRGEPIVVFADRAANPRALELTGESPLHIFSRRVGDVVLYEVSKLPSARVLDLFAQTAMPPEWIKEWERNPKLHFPLEGPPR
jgi:hypothetical protein